MRQYTFWPHRETFRPHWLVPAVTFFLAGLCWAAIAFFENIPERGALKTVAGQVESVTKIDDKGQFYSSYRYDIALKTRENRSVTAKLEQNWLAARDVQLLNQRPMTLDLTNDNWIMAIRSGPGATILTYERSRELWEENKAFRVKFGLSLALFGLVLAGIHLWKVRRSQTANSA